jgi:hypothetical protein
MPVSTVKATSEAMVNVLLYFDEEVEAGYGTLSEDWWYSTLFESNFLTDTAYEIYLYNWNIRLHPVNCAWRSYEYWDSPDTSQPTDGGAFLQYAIQTHGGVDENGTWVYPQTPYYHDGDYYLADLLIFITGEQNLSPSAGYSPPNWNAMYIVNNNGYGIPGVVHELGHMFWIIGHCASNPCVMNENWAHATSIFCDSCFSVVNSHREKYGYKTFALYIERSTGGYTTPPPGYDYQVVVGSNVTITAHCMGGTFDEWYITVSGWPQYRSQNPLEMGMDGQYTTVKPLFIGGGTGGGGGGPMEDLPW